MTGLTSLNDRSDCKDKTFVRNLRLSVIGFCLSGSSDVSFCRFNCLVVSCLCCFVTNCPNGAVGMGFVHSYIESGKVPEDKLDKQHKI